MLWSKERQNIMAEGMVEEYGSVRGGPEAKRVSKGAKGKKNPSRAIPQ